MAVYQELPLHEGETLMRAALKVPLDYNATVPGISPQLANHLQIAPLIALGTLDSEKRPWTTLWGNGENGFAQPLTNAVIGIKTPVTGRHDPVVEELVGKEATGQVIQEEGKGRMVSGLTLDLEKRKRVKMFGRMVAGALMARQDESTDTEEHIAQVQLVLKIEQSLGNCPKYINQKHIVSATSSPKLISDSAQLPQQAVDLIAKSDLFFISSSQHDKDMDTNHRGGPPGFMRVLSNDESGAVLVYPEYSGNRFYQTLGNLRIHPLAGVCVPDFESGDMLYCTGRTEILVGKDAAALLPRSNLAVKLTITSSRFVQTALPFRGVPGELSPYNPVVRYLATEKPSAPSSNAAKSQQHQQATLLRQTKLTPTISRFKFSLTNPTAHKPGQYVTLDFSSQLDIGYSHMRDDDPRSLNDDFVRTFTVSNPPVPVKDSATFSSSSSTDGKEDTLRPDEFEITIRRVGVVTDCLFRQQEKQLASDRGDFEVGVLGFGGEFEIRLDEDGDGAVAFIGAGVGITPLLPSLKSLNLARVRVLWSVRKADVPLVKEVVEKFPGLKGSAIVFVTDLKDGETDEDVQWLMEKGVDVMSRRMNEEDVLKLDGEVERYYLCTSVPMRKQVEQWLPGKQLIFEDFNF